MSDNPKHNPRKARREHRRVLKHGLTSNYRQRKRQGPDKTPRKYPTESKYDRETTLDAYGAEQHEGRVRILRKMIRDEEV